MHNLTAIFFGGEFKKCPSEKKNTTSYKDPKLIRLHTCFFGRLLVTQRTVAPKVATTSTKSTKDEMSGSSS